MADLTAPLRAVVDAPNDDAPRLAYADAVAASDPERAELIRVQVALARARRLRPSLDGLIESKGSSIRREGELIRAHGQAWGADVEPLVGGWQFLRGFVEVVTLDAEAFLARAAEIYRRAPVLHLNLTDVRPVAARLFASPHLRRILSLRVAVDRLGDAEAGLLARSPHLTRLQWLDLSHNQIGSAGLEAIAASESLPSLGYLGFAYNAIEDPTPQHADEWDAESAVGKKLQARYGPRAWLNASVRAYWPPERDAVEYP